MITDLGHGTIDAPLVGDARSGSNGAWQHAVAFTDQWEEDGDTAGANCAPIAGAGSQTYTIQDADADHTIVLQVTAYNYQP